MVEFSKYAWLLAVGLSFLSVGAQSGGDSLNIDLEIVDNIDISGLGPEGLADHQGSYSLTVDQDCRYALEVSFKGHSSDNMANSANRDNFANDCDPVVGEALHAHNRQWMQFAQYVEDTTGFNHMSLNPKPCGMQPLGRRQPRYDVNFYRVPPHYRAMWKCQSFDTPARCQYVQPSFLGRAHFTIPRLWNNKDVITNAPKYYQPDPTAPEAFEYEGLILYHEDNVPQTVADFTSPAFDISTYDGDFGSFRAILPLIWVSGGSEDRSYWGTVVYQYQTLPDLVDLWNVTYAAQSKLITVTLQGEASLCGDEFDAAKAAA